MKPCSKNQKLIVWLAMDALPADRADELRTHIQACATCRAYFEEMADITKALSAAQCPAGVQFSPTFHRRMVRAIAAEAGPSPGRVLLGWFLRAWLNWRLALPIVIGTAAIGIGLFGLRQHPDRMPPMPPIAREGVPSVRAVDLSPTFSNYQMAAEKSPEALDELLTAQARRNPVPAPLYTASSRNVFE